MKDNGGGNMNKTVLITGASRGIGRACAKLFCEKGYNVVANYLNSENDAMSLADEYKNLCIVKADVSDENQVKEMVETAKKCFGKIDVLINNAGVSLQKLFTDTAKDEWDRLFNINLGGVFNCSKEVAKDMIKNHNGKIINISSIWGITGASCEVAYSASKAAVIGLTKSLAKELGPSKICVNCIAPGIIATDMNGNIDAETMESLIDETPLQTIGKPIDVANMALFLAEDSSDFITGQVFGVNGGFLI